MKITMGIVDKCGVRGDATLCVVIFKFTSATTQQILAKEASTQSPLTSLCLSDLFVKKGG